jgi:hypothetical protein
LTGGDYFLHAIDRRMRRTGLTGNTCHIALGLADSVSSEALRRRVASSPLFHWLARVRLARRLPFLPPCWRVAKRAADLVEEHQVSEGSAIGPAGLPSIVLERDLRPDRNPALLVSVVRQAHGGAQIVLSWNHALMDVRGAELLLRHLHADEAATASPALDELTDPNQASLRLVRHWRALPRRLVSARGSLAVVNRTGEEPLFSLSPVGSPVRVRRNQYRLVSFSGSETTRVDEHCQRLNAGFRRSLFYLAATAKALHAVAQGRGGPPGAFLIPVPHDLRRHGATGPIFSNQLSFLFYRLEPHLVDNLSEAIGELTRQMMDQARQHIPDSFCDALETLKSLPPDFYWHRLGRPTRGKFASFFFSDAGETCAGLRALFGAPIATVTHLAPAAWPPGLTLVFWRFRGCLSASIAWVEPGLSGAEVDRLEAGLRAALLGES